MNLPVQNLFIRVQHQMHMTDGIDGKTGFYKNRMICDAGNIAHIVTADHDIHIRDSLICFPKFSGGISMNHGAGKMTQYNDQISTGTANLREQFLQHRGGRLYRKTGKGFYHIGGICCGQTNNSNLNTFSLQHDPGFCKRKQSAGIRPPDIGTENRKGRFGKNLAHGIIAIVKFMVSQGHGIKAKGIADLDNGRSIRQITNWRGTQNITGIQNQSTVRIFCLYLVIISCHFGSTGTMIGFINGSGKISLSNDI